MAKEKLQIILDADWRGKSAVQQADRDVGRLGKTTKKVQDNWKSFAVGAGVAVGALAAVGGAAKIAFAELQRGAALDLAAGQFDKLTESIGSSSDAMLGRLQTASRGMVSNANLIAGANEIMAGKLAKTEDGVVRLSAAAGALNIDMGLLAQTINNQSILRLDNMGVAAEDVIPKFNALKDAGVGVKDAFTQALTEALEAKIALVGETSETTAGKILQMTAAWENARDAFSQGFAEGAAEEIATLAANTDIAAASFEQAGIKLGNTVATLVTEVFGKSIALAELTRLYDIGAISLLEYRNRVGLLENNLASVGGTMAYAEEQQALFELSLAATVSGLDAQVAAAAVADGVMLQYAGTLYTTALAAQKFALHAIAPFGPQPLAAKYTKPKRAIGDTFRLLESDEFGPQSTRDALRKSNAALEETNSRLAQGDQLAGNFFGGIASGANTAADEMARLNAESGSLFDQARRMTEIDPAEFFFQEALSAGASAEQLREALVGTGLKSAEEASQIFDRFKQLESLKAGAQAFAGGGLNLDQAFAAGGGIAAADFSGSTVDQSKTVNVGGVTVIINGNATGEDLEMAIDNAFAKVAQSEGAAP